MFFALGHSCVVLLACCCIILAQQFMTEKMELFQKFGGLIGSSVSGAFLLIIGLVNLYTARQLWRVWRGAECEGHDAMGCYTRCCPRLFRGVTKPWHMLIVGFIFGLGFDTSTEVGLLAIAACLECEAALRFVAQCLAHLHIPWIFVQFAWRATLIQASPRPSPQVTPRASDQNWRKESQGL